MAVLSSLLFSAARLLTPCRLRFWELAVCKRITWLSLSTQRCYTSDISNSSVDHVSPGLDRYKDLQKYFNRRLKATYRRFSNMPDQSVVCGHHHVYFIEGDGIYRMDKRQSEPEPKQVLNLGQVSWQEEKTGLDNEEGKQRFYWTVQRIRLSPQEKHLAATLKSNHGEELRCVVVRLGKRNTPLGPPHVVFTLDKVFSFEWATDEVLFYTILEGLRCSRVSRLDLTSSGSRRISVYEETHPDVFVEVALSRDQHILSINCNSRTSSEVRLIDITTSHLEPFLVQSRQPDLLYHVEHWRSWLIILSNTGPGQEYQVVQAPLSEPSIVSWVPLYAPGPGTAIKDMDVVGDHCVLVARTPAGELVLIVVPLTHPKEAYTVQLPSWACAIKTKKPGLADQGSVLEFLISSPVHSPVSYCLYPEDGLLLLGTEDYTSYTTTRLEACNQDGTLVPVTLFHTVPVESLRQTPLLVHVYGAYGRDLNMEFCPEKRLLLEQGWALAYCHIRGGGERGLSWQRQARVEGKQRGVEDLKACLHHLFSLGVSSPLLTALTACSAGAVPVGALCNRHPHMMRAVTLQAPFLDVLGTMEDPSLPLTLEDREEWGDPVRNPQHRLTISSYCPLYNITPQCYPSILLTAYSGDARVPLAGVLKYNEQLKNAIHTHFTMKPKSECEPVPNIVLNIQPGANHLGPEDFDLMLEEEALKLAFLYTELGLDPPRPPRKRKR
ncbi:prolyl endopeptidase-like isoform X1 [Micropterus salmoides]|uniref:prolyl endopeptidase-like isoform X1 n=1 Tax=Micropterus salmoides TaxID=27706 RepID=UPI0018EC599B|nr:prolyl endopeptidase-like isoform X1 [Micropterus salmoides]